MASIHRSRGFGLGLGACAALAVFAVLAFLVRGGSLSFPSGAPAEPLSLADQLRNEIRGTDGDQNGVRDDVEAWVVARFPEGSVGRLAFQQVAASYQRVLLSTSEPEQSMRDLHSLSEALTCARQAVGPGAEEQIVRLKAVVLDTDVRVRAWLKAYERWDESGTQAEPASVCRS